MQLSVDELAKLVEGTVEGDGSVLIDRPAKIEEAGPGSISFLANMKYEHFIYDTKASALLIPIDFQPKQPVNAVLIRVENVYDSIRQLLDILAQDSIKQEEKSVADQAIIHPHASIGEGVQVGAYSIIKQGAEIGEGTLIADQVFIGANVKIGRACRLFPGVRIMHNCSLGDHCVVHPNTVIGSDGFGFAPQADGSYQKIPQVGNVIVEDEVEIGANVAIDRATMGSTIIRRGVKIDNLVQIAHNVEVGANTVIAGQAGIAGSTKIGKNCRIGGQVGFAGHLTIADGSNFQAQSGVMQSIKTENGRFFGTPIMGYTAFMKSSLALRDLPELVREINRLKKQLAILEDEVQS